MPPKSKVGKLFHREVRGERNDKIDKHPFKLYTYSLSAYGYRAFQKET